MDLTRENTIISPQKKIKKSNFKGRTCNKDESCESCADYHKQFLDGE